MPDVTKHAPGTFSWPELATSDQAAAVRFYGSLFGWTVDNRPMGPAGVYSMFTLRGKPVAAASTLPDDERQMGVPPHWNNYVTVENADATAKRAESLGGTVLASPFDVMDVGRMAVLQDPTGAVFQVWQPKAHIGAAITGEPGTLCWTELTTSDLGRAESFYTGLFGWTAKRSAPGSPMQYTEMSNQGQPGVGMMPKPPQMPAHIPSYWMPYLLVSDVDNSTKQATSLGASVIVGPQDIENMGRFSVLHDPQGAVFAMFQSGR